MISFDRDTSAAGCFISGSKNWMQPEWNMPRDPAREARRPQRIPPRVAGGWGKCRSAAPAA
jgi:hypothetical protein